jgi:hypothetical protein
VSVNGSRARRFDQDVHRWRVCRVENIDFNLLEEETLVQSDGGDAFTASDLYLHDWHP